MKFSQNFLHINDIWALFIAKLFPDKAWILYLKLVAINAESIFKNTVDLPIGAIKFDFIDGQRSKTAVSLHKTHVAKGELWEEWLVMSHVYVVCVNVDHWHTHNAKRKKQAHHLPQQVPVWHNAYAK